MPRRRPPNLNVDLERKLAISLFNYTWTLIKKKRTRSEDEEMMHTAHASRWHWGRVGNAHNIATGEWQISRVYSVIGMLEPALYHAKRCLAHQKKGEMKDFDLPYAYEALARAYAIAGKKKESSKYLNLAEKLGQDIMDKEDRDLLIADLNSVRQIIRRQNA